MLSLIQRQLRLFFSHKSNVFFALMGAIVAFVLYLIFLQHNMVQSFPAQYGTAWLDPWIIGGTLTITAITTTLSALSQRVIDQERGLLADLAMTGIPNWQLQLSYFLGAVLLGWGLQLIIAALLLGGFAVSDGIAIPWAQIPALIGMSGFSSLLWTSFNLLCLTFVRRVDTLGGLSTIIGTAAGFFAGVYLPMGSLPTLAQTLMKLTPAPYNAALYRQILLHDQLTTTTPVSVEQALGLRLTWQTPLTITQIWEVLLGFLVAFLVLALWFSRHARQTALTRS